MTATDKFWAYLSPILEQQRDAHEVVKIQLSDADRMDRFVADSRSEEVYPGIFVMRPVLRGKTTDNALLIGNFKTKFYVFVKGDMDSYESQDAAYQQAETIANDIVKQVQHDSRTYKCYFDINTLKMEPVAYFVLDAAWGYEVELVIGVTVNEIFC